MHFNRHTRTSHLHKLTYTPELTKPYTILEHTYMHTYFHMYVSFRRMQHTDWLAHMVPRYEAGFAVLVAAALIKDFKQRRQGRPMSTEAYVIDLRNLFSRDL